METSDKSQFVLSYEGPVYRPPSEASSLILQATIGCSWNHCTYCAMYRHKAFRRRPLAEILGEIRTISRAVKEHKHPEVRRIFVGDGDALVMPTEDWRAILTAISEHLPKVTRVSCYATAQNLLEKNGDELKELRAAGLRLLYIGPESGDDKTLKAIAKGASFSDHIEAGKRAVDAGMQLSLIFLLGAGGVERSDEHAIGAARLTTEMDPRYVSLLTLTVIADTPLSLLQERGRFKLPTAGRLLEEIRSFVERTEPSNAVFRSNHASNYLPLAGRLPRDRDRLLAEIDAALSGLVPLRPEWTRRL